MSSRVATNFMGIFAGNSTLEKAFRSTVKMTEIIPEFTE
jgi:hypothetical protein